MKLTQKGVDGRLQAILRAHENEMGDFELHLDGQASDFLPDNGLWQWRYWGKAVLRRCMPAGMSPGKASGATILLS